MIIENTNRNTKQYFKFSKLMYLNSYEENLIDETIEDLEFFFMKSKQCNINVYDDDFTLYKKDDYTIITIDEYNLIDFHLSNKNKSFIRQYMRAMIGNNEKFFETIEKIRILFRELNTDDGIVMMTKNLSNGCDNSIDIHTCDVTVDFILSILEISLEKVLKNEKLLIFINLISLLEIKEIVLFLKNLDIKIEDLKKFKSKRVNIIIVDTINNDLASDILFLKKGKNVSDETHINEEFTSYIYGTNIQTKKYKEFQSSKIKTLIDSLNNAKNSIFLEFSNPYNEIDAL